MNCKNLQYKNYYNLLFKWKSLDKNNTQLMRRQWDNTDLTAEFNPEAIQIKIRLNKIIKLRWN